MGQLPAGAYIVEDPHELAVFFSDVPAAHVYALADLEAPFWDSSRWYRRGDAVVGLVQLPDSPSLTVYGVATRNQAANLALIVDLLPLLEAGTLITAPIGLADVVSGLREIAWSGPHERLALQSPRRRGQESLATVESIDRDRLADLVVLYESDPGAVFFRPSMIDDASFVGVYEDGRLVAAAGTHVVSELRRCAAVGCVFTLRSHRGRGLARATTAGVIERILDRVDLIGLNVATENLPAQAVYGRLGFQSVLSYEEAELS